MDDLTGRTGEAGTAGDGGRLLVVMCDGTGNAIEGDLSNVMKLYRACVHDERQRMFYDPGVGTIGSDSAWGRLRQRSAAAFGLATGFGLDDNILDGYRFLCRTHGPGDSVMLFGFSRGAYTVRAIAGLVHAVGLLGADQENLAGEALNAYKHSAEREDLTVGWDFGKVLRTKRVAIDFMGIWDTVASVIVPRPDRFYLPSLRRLPYTRTNPSVQRVRHAVALDERRRMFRLNRWVQDQPFQPHPVTTGITRKQQDVLQMAFAGVHADIGGGYPEAQSALAKFPLTWMADEAEAAGLRIDRAMLTRMLGGAPGAGNNTDYVAPDAAGPIHHSLSGPWWLLEWLPRANRWRETRQPGPLGFYLPRGESRDLPDGTLIHPSVVERARLVPTYGTAGVAGNVRDVPSGEAD